MRTRNQFRKSKMQEIQALYDLYPDLPLHERLFKVLHELVKRAIQKNDYTELGSLNEFAKIFEGLFINPQTGRPTADALNWVRKLITKIKKDKAHPHIRIYAEPHVEVDATGEEVVRYYLNLLRGSRAVIFINNMHEKHRTRLREQQNANKEATNVKRVMKEADTYSNQLEQKQRDANAKREEEERELKQSAKINPLNGKKRKKQ